jgi:hypothetical protein
VKKWGIILILVCAAGFAGWRWVSPVPRIEFQRFEEDHQGRRAIFKIVNEGSHSAYFYGYAISQPLFRLRTLSANGWKPESPGWCGTGAVFHAIAAGGSSEFSVHISPDRRGEAFQAGVHLMPGTPPASGSSHPIERWIWKIRHLFGLGDPDPTWSDTVRS